MRVRTAIVRWGAVGSIVVAVAAGSATIASAAPLTAAAGASIAGSTPCSSNTAVTCISGVPYSGSDLSAETLDVYYPNAETDRASLVIIHGGRWLTGSSASFAAEAMYFAENGFAVFDINYTLSRPGHPSWPKVRSDVEGATAWVMAHADEYHGDDSRVAVLGGSSGGQLAALVDTDGPLHGVSPVAAVSWSGAMDLKLTYQEGNGAAQRGIYQFLGCTPRQCPQTYADASPVTHVATGDGSMLFFHSADERVPIAGAREMNQALAAADVPHRLVVLKHSTLHAREYECMPVTLDGETLPVIDASMRWLGTRLGQPTQPSGTFCQVPTKAGTSG